MERSDEDMYFYKDGVTPSVGAVEDKVDAERLAVAKALGVKATPTPEWLRRYYGATDISSIYTAVQSTPVFRSHKMPAHSWRYSLDEMVPYGLVPIASLGNALGVPTPVTDAVVDLTSAVDGRDYWSEGTSVEKMGLKGFSTEQIIRYINEPTS